MTKQDLKTGMLVQYENGEIRMVINNMLVGTDEYNEIDNYKDNLTCIGCSEFSLTKVSKVLKNISLIPEYWTEETINNNLLWERTKNEYTIEELEQLTGIKNLKIKK